MALKNVFTKSTVIRLLLIWLVVLVFKILGAQLMEGLGGLMALAIFIALLLTIVYASFGVVREADQLAHKLGEPYGTLILTLSIVSIEVILISAVMLGPGETETIGRDSIFSVMMIIMNLVMGLCILLGALKYGEQEYNAQGAMSYHGMIILLGGMGLLLPNTTISGKTGEFTTVQALFISALVVAVYGLFLFFQMKGYKRLFVQPQKGSTFVSHGAMESGLIEEEGKKVFSKEIIVRTLVLLLMILSIVLLSHDMATVVDYGIKAANLPELLGGVLIAVIVFTPESITAVKAALNNEMQRAVNLCQGAFVSTVGLTIPSVLIIGELTGKVVKFGISATETVLFVVTLLLSTFTFMGQRTTPISGVMHLAIFILFIMLIFAP